MLKVHATACGSETTNLGADFFELRVRRLAGEFQIVQHHRPERRLRPVGPDRIDRIGFARHQRRAGVGAGASEPLGSLGGDEPRVVAELRFGLQVFLQPTLRRDVADQDDLEHVHVGLRAGLQRVPPIDEQRRLVGQHHRAAGRAGEAGEPGQPLLGRRHVFVLMPVRPRQIEA
jgi:hypothetical protein